MWIVKKGETYATTLFDSNGEMVWAQNQKGAWRASTRNEAMRDAKDFGGRVVRLRTRDERLVETIAKTMQEAVEILKQIGSEPAIAVLMAADEDEGEPGPAN